MANIIKIKRSSSTATPLSLNEGELAFSYLSGKLFIGNSSAVIPIGGEHVPGVLTANQALVANATSGIDKIIVSNAVIDSVWANGAAGTDGQTLTSNSTGGVYWAAPVTSLAGLSDVTLSSTSNNDLLIYDADAGKWENHTISGNAGQVSVAFNSQDITVSLEATVNVATAINVGSNVNIATNSITIGNSTVNAVLTAESLDIDGAITSGNVTVTGFVNATSSVQVGSDVVVNTTALSIGNSTVNTVITADSINLGGNVTTANLTVSSLITVGSNVTVNTSTIFIGNSTVNTTIEAGNITLLGTQLTVGNTVFDGTTISVGNSTVNTTITQSSIDVDGTITGGNTDITGFISVSSTANVGGDTFLRGDVTVNGALVVANTAALGNTDITGYANVSTLVNVGNSTVYSVVNTTSFSTGLTVVNTSAVAVGSNVVANTSALFVGNSTVKAVITSSTFNIDGDITALDGQFEDLTVTGNLTVQGTLTTIDTTNLVIKDPMIKLANNNTSDTVDIGFYGQWNDGTTKYDALVRDQTDSKWKLWTGITSDPSTVVDFGSGSAAALVVGALEAASLSLTSALTVGNGGTGTTTFTEKGVIYGNGTSALQVTAAGTDGQVLQANSTGYPVWGDLDGGTF